MIDPSDPAPALRRADDADAGAIAELVDAAYVGYTPLLGRTPFPMLADYADAVRSHDVWVLDDAGRIVGVIELVARDDHLWIENVAIAPIGRGEDTVGVSSPSRRTRRVVWACRRWVS